VRELVRPRFWAAHLVMVLAVVVAVLAGIWQLSVWQAARAASTIDPTKDAPVALAHLMGGDSAFPGRALGRPVRFSGTWLSQSTLFVKDRELHGRRGYWVVTPVLVGKSAMPVVRGWSTSATAPAVDGQVSLTGWLQPSEDTGATDTDPDDDVIPEMATASLVQHVDDDLYSAFVVQDGATGGLDQVTPASTTQVSSTDHLRNLLYAFQWWIFGGLAIYIWWRWCRDQLDPEAAQAARERQPVGG
jgi:surfeit locus 1 family protein